VHMQRVVELLRFGYGARPIRATRGSRDLPALQRGDRSEAWPSGTREKRGNSVVFSGRAPHAELEAQRIERFSASAGRFGECVGLSLVHELPCRGI
jgi:hypothetical protein